MKKLKWLLFDRTITDTDGYVFDKLDWDSSLLVTFPKLWKLGTIRSECGCVRRFYSKKKILICLPHVKERLNVED